MEVTAEVHFAQRLASNEKKTRLKALKKLRKYLEAKSSSKKESFCEEDFLKLWKGLHYSLWMQDKPLLQEELVDSIARLVHCFSHIETQFLFIHVFFVTEAREWNGIDRWRLDKFMMIVRRMLEESFKLVQKHDWKDSHIETLMELLSETVMHPTDPAVPDGLKIHLADIYLGELDTVASSQLPPDKVLKCLHPFSKFVPRAENTDIAKRVISRTFEEIIQQVQNRLSAGADVEEAKKKDEQDKTVDHSIGDWKLQFDHGMISDHLFELSKNKSCLGRNRKLLYKLVGRFKDLHNAQTQGQDENREPPQNGARQVRPLETLAKKTKIKNKQSVLPETEVSQDPNAADISSNATDSYENKSHSDDDRPHPAETEISSSDKKSIKSKKRKLSHSATETSHHEKKTQGEVSRTTEKLVKSKKRKVSLAGEELTHSEKKKMKEKQKDHLWSIKSSESKLDSQEDNSLSKEKSALLDEQDKKVEKPEKLIKSKRKRKGDEIVMGTQESPPDKKRIQTDKCENDGKSKGSEIEDSPSVMKEMDLKGKIKDDISVNDKKKSRKSISAAVSVKKVKDKGAKLALTSGEPDKPEVHSGKEVVAPDLEEEIEIWIPNKKYKGKYKDFYATGGTTEEDGKSSKSENQSEMSEGSTPKSSDKNISNKQLKKMPKPKTPVFASFEKTKTPPAFVRKAMTKLRTPATEPVRRHADQNINFTKARSEKRKSVTFDEGRNTKQEFKKNMPLTPTFDPQKKPDQGILKSSGDRTPVFSMSRQLLPQKLKTPKSLQKSPSGKKSKSASKKKFKF